MKNILLSLNKTVFAGFILTFVFVAYYFLNNNLLDIYFWQFTFRYVHVLAGTMWIGLLWYFNFVQIPNILNIPE